MFDLDDRPDQSDADALQYEQDVAIFEGAVKTLAISEIVIEGELFEEYDPEPRPGTVVLSRMRRTLGEMPEGTILQTATSDDEDADEWDALAYRVTTFEWSVTGHVTCVTSDKLSKFAAAWTVVRVGGAR